jgi:phosphomevalonate kinase
MSTTAVSAPGKVLFAGGFLVLDRAHTGVVFGLDARIHVLVAREALSLSTPQDPLSTAASASSLLLLVQSPQFRDANWGYSISGNGEKKLVRITQVQGVGSVGLECGDGGDGMGLTASRNKFVETTLRYVLTYVAHVRSVGEIVGQDSKDGLRVRILADDDYYSSSASSNKAPEEGRRKGFADFGVKLSDAHKTGLGSSAALTTALVGALLNHYLGADPSQRRLSVVHNLAQAAHCAAQGKVGSGFDVAAAVYGSCLYRRFTPSVLEAVGEAESDGFGERLHRCVEDLADIKWDVEVYGDRVKVPEGLLLVLCDVDCGSETPSMVRKMLAWRKEKPEEASVLWTSLQMGQEELCKELDKVGNLLSQDSRSDTYDALGDTISTIRSLVREMSVKSGVPVEPEVITELLDYCSSIGSVVGGMAPGAGGYDAVALLVRNDGQAVDELQRRLQGWKSSKAGAQIGQVSLLDVKQDNEGVRVEDAGDQRYAAWISL